MAQHTILSGRSIADTGRIHNRNPDWLRNLPSRKHVPQTRRINPHEPQLLPHWQSFTGDGYDLGTEVVPEGLKSAVQPPRRGNFDLGLQFLDMHDFASSPEVYYTAQWPNASG